MNGFCNPAAGWVEILVQAQRRGGQVEKNVRDCRHQMLQGMPGFADLAALNAWLEERCLALWRETPHGKQPPSHACEHALPANGHHRRCLNRLTGTTPLPKSGP